MTPGYDRPSAKPIVITSSGNAASTISKVESDSANFEIGGIGATVPAGGSIGTWTVQPVAGLAVGVHEATITVTYNNGATATARASLTVNAPPVPTTWSIPATFKATKGFSYQLAKASPDGRELPQLTFIRSNKNASISVQGVLTAKSTGTITITAKDASGTSMKCKVTVVGNSFSRGKPLMLDGGGVFSSMRKLYYQNKKLYVEVFVLNRTGKSIKRGGDLRLELRRGDELLYTKPLTSWKPGATLKNKKYAIYKLCVKESVLPGVSAKVFDLGRGEIQAVIVGTDVYGNTYTPVTPQTPGTTKAKGFGWALTEDLDELNEPSVEYPIP